VGDQMLHPPFEVALLYPCFHVELHHKCPSGWQRGLVCSHLVLSCILARG
jgi:hypothetical protein